jgi:hypothetical protein
MMIPRMPLQLRLGAIALLAVIPSCSHSAPERFWRQGTTYDLTLRVRQRAPRMPSLPPVVADSLHGRFTLDSIRGDSLFGRYAGHLDSLDVQMYEDSTTPIHVAGRLSRDSLTMSIGVNVIDAELLLDGTWGDTAATGVWFRHAPPSVNGDFSMRRLSERGR